MLHPSLIVDAQSPIKRPVPEKQILWPTATGFAANGVTDSIWFPQIAAVHARMKANPAAPLEAFANALRDAEDRILILDKALFKPDGDGTVLHRIQQVLVWLDPERLRAPDIRILTGGCQEQDIIKQRLIEHGNLINRMRPSFLTRVTVQIKFLLRREFPHVHDRFAIVDNDLWHFGATVGGLHNRVNAASHGWDTEEHGAVEFFEAAWNSDAGAGGAKRGGRRR